MLPQALHILQDVLSHFLSHLFRRELSMLPTELLSKLYTSARSIPQEPYILISIATQTLYILEAFQVCFQCTISTAKNGAGELFGSGCTPRGWFVIKAKIGKECPENTVFVGRRATGEIYNADLHAQFPSRDWILSRILWLGGVEPYKNRYGHVDTLRRFIYIHGTPASVTLGIANSKGCIRMHNKELLFVFEHVRVGTPVFITE